jgi:uncharacterized protein
LIEPAEEKLTAITLTASQAQRFLLTYQGLLPPRSWNGKAGILEYFQRVGCIQFDPLNIVGHNPDLVLQSRVSDYRPRLLYNLLYQDRRLLDGWDKMMAIYRLEDFPYFRRQREADRASMEQSEDRLKAVLPLVRTEIEQRGPLCSLDLDFEHRVNWPWGPTRASRAALESLYFAGELVVHHKVNTRKYYDLAHRHIPAAILQAGDPNQSETDYLDWYVLRRLGSVGLLWNRASIAWLAMRGIDSPLRAQTMKRLLVNGRLVEVYVEGISDPLYLRSQDLPILEQAALVDEDSPSASFIAPLDNLMWDRRLVEDLFGFEYRWEVYTPPAKRKYGYYVLPVLYGDRFIARVEPVLEKRSRVLTIKNWWWEEGVTPDEEMVAALADCFEHFFAYLGASSIRLNSEELGIEETGQVAALVSDHKSST